MKRTPLIPIGAIFRRERMLELVEVDWPSVNDIKDKVAIYDSIQQIAAIWDWPSAKFVRLKSGESVVYKDMDGVERRYVQR